MLPLSRANNCRHMEANHTLTTSWQHVIAANASSMTTTVWKDFATGNQGIIQVYQGHADGFVESTNTSRPTVACPFHSLTTLTPSPGTAPRQRDPHPASQERTVYAMAVNTFFPDNDALKLMPLRQQIIGEPVLR